MEKTCAYLTAAEIIEINKRQVNKFGGKFYLRSPGSLRHMLEEVRGFLFGEELYPGVFNKAAFLMHRLVQGHFFFDGNKRTGLEVCRVFLYLNSYFLRLNPEDEVVKFVKSIANKEVDQSEIEEWLKDRCTL